MTQTWCSNANKGCSYQLSTLNPDVAFVDVVEFTDARFSYEKRNEEPVIPLRSKRRLCLGCFAELLEQARQDY